MASSSSSDEDDDNFLRSHAKAIAEALQQRDAVEEALAASSTTKSQRERMVHETYIALCYDDPRVESDLACQYLAMALLDPKSPYALSGPLVEGIRQLCAKQQEQQQNSAVPATTTTTTPESSSIQKEAEPLTAAASTETSALAKGSALLAWAIGARIPLLCCQASELSEVHKYLGSYRPSPPPNPLVEKDDDGGGDILIQKLANNNGRNIQSQEEADQLAAMLSQPPPADDNVPESKNDDDSPNNNPLLEEEEVWAAESDPSDFEFESGFSYEQQLADVEDTFAAWMMDRTDPIKLSTPPTSLEATTTTWKQVRHAVMELTSQLNYRHVASIWNQTNSQAGGGGLMGSRGPSDILAQFTMTLLVPPSTSTTTSNRPSIFDSPDDAEDALQPQRQLQAMAWYPLWVARDAAANNVSNLSYFTEYLNLLQNLIAVDAAAGQPITIPQPPPQGATTTTTMAPATYVGLASLSALCQQFVTDGTATTGGNNNKNQLAERYRVLRRTVWETCDDLSHALEQEDKIRKAAAKPKDKDNHESTATASKDNSHWIVWTLLPLFEILTNQQLQTGSTIVANAESLAQRHHNQQQASQQWSAGLLQSGLFRHWLLRCQILREQEGTETSAVLWQFVRRSLLYTISQSMPVTSALGKYAWRFPSFTSIVEIGESYHQQGQDSVALVDEILWNLLAMELAGSVTSSAPTIQWKSTAKKPSSTVKPLPTRLECQKVSWEDFHELCESVVHVLELVCQEENKKENTGLTDTGKDSNALKSSPEHDDIKLQHQLVLQSFQRFVDCLAACPLLANLFVNHIQPESGKELPDETISKCLDGIHKALSQYKAPSPDLTKGSTPKAKEEDGQAEMTELEASKAAKEKVQDASLEEAIHMVRKQMKMLRSMLTTKTSSASSTTSMLPQDLTSSSKTD